MPHDSPLLRVHTLGSEEGRMQHNELMDLVTKLSDRVVSLETGLQQTNKVYGAAYTKLMKKERKFAQIDEDERIILVQMGTQTQGRHDHEMEADFEFTTAEDVSTANVLVNTTEERQRIASIHEEVSTFKPEEWDNVQAQIEADEELAHRLQVQERERYSEANKAKLLVELINERKRHFSQQRAQQRRNMPLAQAQQILFEEIVKRVNTFTLMESDDTVSKVVTGSSKRSAEEELGKESSKRQKIGEGSELTKESKDKESDELSQEQLQQLMITVLEEGMNVDAL
ncbi:hypothetical protein Tco_0561510 [Tanacetum coccineum]